MNRPTEELMRIATAGAGFQIYGSGRTTDDLMRIAACMLEGAQLIITGMQRRSIDDLVRIAACGNHTVLFMD